MAKAVGIFAASFALLWVIIAWVNREPSYQGQPLSQWLEATQSKDLATRSNAVAALKEMGPEAASRLALHLTQKPGLFQRVHEKYGNHIPERIKTLARKALHPLHPIVEKKQAAEALRQMGTNGTAAIPALRELLNDKSILLSSFAGNALGEMGAEAVPALLTGLENQDYSVRANACHALGRIGEGAADAVPGLVMIVTNETGPIVPTAAYTLSRVGPPAIPAVLPILSSTNKTLRYWGAYALSYMGPPASNAMPALIELVQDPDPKVRTMALTGINTIERYSDRWMQALLSATHDSNPGVQATAIQYLALDRRALRENVSRLAELLEAPAPEARYQAAEALKRLGPRGKSAMAKLEALQDDPEEYVRTKAKEALASVQANPG